MGDQDDFNLSPRFFFTAPWEPIVVRRGDALGLRALADQFAEELAPELSNRVRDGRWVTILAWCLVRSQSAFCAGGGGSISTAFQQKARYAWLRPLELMWVARTICLSRDWKRRSLAGQRRVHPWYEDGRKPLETFGMSGDQLRGYRQTGMYGGYRLAFRKWPGMTNGGDGWTPGPASLNLASWLDDRLGTARPSWPLHAGNDHSHFPPSPDKRSRGKEHVWWLRHWNTYDKNSRNSEINTLPRPRDEFGKLPEFSLLKPLVFGSSQSGSRRLRVANEVARSLAGNHLEVCEHLGRVFANNSTIMLLPHFSRLADAGIAGMDLVAKALKNKSHINLSDVVRLPNAANICKELFIAAREWSKTARVPIRHIESAHRFAEAINNEQPAECLRALLYHHEAHGGGLRWFVLRNNLIEVRTPSRGGSSRYRFRLWALCRLATQCGILRKMPSAIKGDVEEEEDETSDNADE